jgi:hypothetical protein
MKDEMRKNMSRHLIAILVLVVTPPWATGQTATILGGEPKEVVEQYWGMGVRGELLTPEGWEASSGLFTKPNPIPQDSSLDVYSNDYGVDPATITGNTAVVTVGFANVGRVDSALRYTPPPKTQFYKTALVFRLALTPLYIRMFGPDGKTEIERKPTGNSGWKISETFPRPWTTVNTAIRFVLESRNKINDPVIKKNADETLTKLLTLH